MSLLQNSVEPCYLPFSWWVNCCFHNSFIAGFGKLKKPQKKGRKDGFPPQAMTLASSGRLLTWARLSVFVTKRGHFTHISNVWGLDKIFSFLMEQPLWGSHCELGPRPNFQHGSRSLYSLLPVYLPAVSGGESRPLRVLPIRPLVLRQNPSLPVAAHKLELKAMDSTWLPGFIMKLESWYFTCMDATYACDRTLSHGVPGFPDCIYGCGAPVQSCKLFPTGFSRRLTQNSHQFKKINDTALLSDVTSGLTDSVFRMSFWHLPCCGSHHSAHRAHLPSGTNEHFAYSTREVKGREKTQHVWHFVVTCPHC